MSGTSKAVRASGLFSSPPLSLASAGAEEELPGNEADRNEWE